MKIGALTETVTVSGEAPLVDTRNARKQTIVSSDLLNMLPSSVKNLNNLVALTPGFRGNEGFDVTGAYTGQIGGTYHGKGGTNVQFDGMGIQHASGNQGYNANAETVQELAMTDERHLGRQQRRRRHRQHDSEGRRQQVQGRRHGPLLQQEPDERQPERRSDRPRPQERQRAELHLRCRLHARRTDQEGPALVLRARSANGATSGRPPTSSTTRRSTRRSTPRISAGRRTRRSGTSPRPCV